MEQEELFPTGSSLAMDMAKWGGLDGESMSLSLHNTCTCERSCLTKQCGL